MIFGSLPVLGSVPFSSLRWTPPKRNGPKGRTGGRQTPTQKATRPRPKATATSRRPEPHPENTVQKERGSNRETNFVT